jgi:hypothetical protein
LYIQSPGNGLPTVTNYYERGYNTGDEKIEIEYPTSGTWRVLVKKFSGEGKFTLSYKILTSPTPVNDDWAFIGSTVHFWPPADRNTLVAKVDGSNNVIEGPYILPYEYLYAPERFINDEALFQGSDPIYKLNLTTKQLLNLFTIDANQNEKLLFAQGAYGVADNFQSDKDANQAIFFMYPLVDNISFPLKEHISSRIDKLPETNVNNLAK